MGEGQTSSLLSALKLDEQPLINQFMLVEELNNADGSFVLSSVIKDQIERSNNIVLIMCHNTLGHFHSISQKLGYNIMSLKESGKLVVFDILEKIIKDNFLSSKEPLRELYLDIKKQIEKWEDAQGVSIILENIGNLLLVDIKEIYTFISYLRALCINRKNSNFVCLVHNFPESTNFDKFTKAVEYFSDIIVLLKDLETGRANDVTGYLTITRLGENYTSCTSEYQYQLQDKSIMVFAPGLRNLL